MKVGIEVEGRMQGLRTLFCSAEEYVTDNVALVAGEQNITQIYISDHENMLDLSGSNKDLILYTKYYIITIERTKVDDNVSPLFNIMLAVNSDSFWNLRPNDQIKFSIGQEVYAVTKRNMTHTVPEDFAGDIEIE